MAPELSLQRCVGAQQERFGLRVALEPHEGAAEVPLEPADLHMIRAESRPRDVERFAKQRLGPVNVPCRQGE
jgi:hypothetical protein